MKNILMLLMLALTALPFAAQAEQESDNGPVIEVSGCSVAYAANDMDDIYFSTKNFQQEAAAKCLEKGYPYQETVHANWARRGRRSYACLVGTVRCEK